MCVVCAAIIMFVCVCVCALPDICICIIIYGMCAQYVCTCVCACDVYVICVYACMQKVQMCTYMYTEVCCFPSLEYFCHFLTF